MGSTPSATEGMGPPTMTLDGYNAFCAGLPATSSVVQWGGAHVWKGVALSVTFKCSWASFDILKEQPGLRPAPYLASRGMSWIQRLTDETMPDEALQDYLRESHRLVAAGLTKRARAELGLDVPTRSRSRQG